MKLRLSPALETALDEFRRQLLDRFGSRLISLTLFGSHARGEARPDSDVDVLVILDRVSDHTERVLPMELAAAFDGILLAPVVLSRAELELLHSRQDLFAENLTREGIALIGEAA